MKELSSRLRWRHVVVSIMVGWSMAFVTLPNAKALPNPLPTPTPLRSLFEDGGTCPAWQQNCNFTGGTIPYFAPNPFDVGRGCDTSFLSYTNDPLYDQDSNGIDDRSCYGKCDWKCNTGQLCDYACYANCQIGLDGMSGYAGCLRGAFGLGARQQPINVDARNTRSLAGNIFRSCVAGNVPFAFTEDYNTCIAGGISPEACCGEIAGNFP